MKTKKKIYLVKREVIASNIHEAMRARGIIYAIEESNQAVTAEKPVQGFKRPKKK